MDSSIKKSNPHPQEKAGFISNTFHWWTVKIFKIAYKKSLSLEDLCDPLSTDRATILGEKLEKQWNIQYETAEASNKKPRLWKVIFYTFQTELYILAICHAISEIVLPIVGIILLGMLLKCFQPKSTVTNKEVLIYGISLSIIEYIKAIFVNNKYFKSVHVGGRIRVATSSLIYRKALQLNKTTIGDRTPGKIVNLISFDVNRFENIVRSTYIIWSGPIILLIIGIILYLKYGFVAHIGMVILVFLVRIQVIFSYVSAKYKKRSASKTDERMRLLEEIISAIKVIKMYAWEKPFCNLVEIARDAELKIIERSIHLEKIFLIFKVFIPRFGFFCVIVIIYIFDIKFSVGEIFVLFPYYYLIADNASLFSRGIVEITEGLISMRRIEAFLLLDECVSQTVKNDEKNFDQLEKNFNALKNRKKQLLQGKFLKCDYASDKQITDNFDNETWAIKFEDLIAKWNFNSSDNTLENINLELEKGKLYMLVGMIGTGKSSLLSSILGEMNTVSGHVYVNGKLSYASQDPWVFGDTIRQNILFGEELSYQRYYRTTEVCSLLQDFKQLPDGEYTVIGEKGISLSGGQKARINLARAVYRDADIYLLDDPLSGVDAHVGKDLFNKCIINHLGDKTRILATHQLQYIKYVDGIIHIDRGQVTYFSDYHQFLGAFPEYKNLIAIKETEESKIKEIVNDIINVPKYENITEIKNLSKVEDIIDESPNKFCQDNLILKYLHYKSSIFLVFTLCLLFAITQIVIIINDYYVLVFLKAQDSRYYHYNTLDNYSSNSNNHDQQSTEFYLYGWIGLIVSILILGIIRSLMYCFMCMHTSKYLHKAVFGALIRTHLKFFHENSSGRILNRLSKDILIVDEFLPNLLIESVQIYLSYIGSVVLACTANPYFLIFALIMVFIYNWIRMYFSRLNRHIKQLEGITRAPVFTHLNESLNGLFTIRAYNAENLLQKEFDKFQDVHTTCWYCFLSCKAFYGMAVKVLNTTFTSIIIIGIGIFRDYFDEGFASLAITQIFSMGGIFVYGTILSAEVDILSTSVERLIEYSQLPSEHTEENDILKQRYSKNSDQLSRWPSKGNIKFIDLCLRYSEKTGLVLKKVNFYIESGQKVGVVGRTGAGKTSLVAALFRLAEIEGTIEIDGVDTKSLSLETLRSQISIIPQDPIVFSSTIRHNVDPFHEFCDDEIWSALEQVELRDTIASLVNGLESKEEQNYDILLICLARAILRKNRILVMDEATANVDPQTDILIQKTVKTKFSSCTVLTIAHRLNTIMDNDKVIVMDNGHLIEFDHPYILLQNKSSKFTALVKETGEAMYQQLFKIAKKSYKNKVIKLE